MSLTDRTLRLLVAIIISVLYFTGVVTGTWAYVFVILACILLSTAIVGLCPLYMIFGIHTNAGKNKTYHNQ